MAASDGDERDLMVRGGLTLTLALVFVRGEASFCIKAIVVSVPLSHGRPFREGFSGGHTAVCMKSDGLMQFAARVSTAAESHSSVRFDTCGPAMSARVH